MYFEIDNTPEHMRKSRRVVKVQEDAPKEECPRLILAPFSRPPQVCFDDVLIGTTCERDLEVFNPSKCVQQVTLARSLPHGLEIQLPGDWLVLEPETCYCLTMSWTPLQPIALRETIHFTNEKRGRYDVIVVLKSAMNIKGKNQPKGKVPPGNNKKKGLKKSPVTINKKKVETNFNATAVRKVAQVVQPSQFKKFQSSNKENISGVLELSLHSQQGKCPFDSSNNFDVYFNTTEIFSNMKRELLQQTYDKSIQMNITNELPIPRNVLKPSNKQQSPGADIFDNLTFTPLKSMTKKKEKLEHGPKIVLSMNSDCEDDSLDTKENDENGPHSIMYVTSSQPTTNKWMSMNPIVHPQNHYLENATVQVKKIPNTSSPKELHSPNFSINTDFSRISDLSFCPPRFSTERKMFPKINNDTHDLIEDFDMRPNSDTFTKEPSNAAFDYQMFYNPSNCRQSLFREYNLRKEFDKNQFNGQKYETNVWRNEPRNVIKSQSPPRSITPPPLQSIPEESRDHNSETHILDKTEKQMHTFTVDQTFDTTSGRTSTNRQTWSKRDVRADPTLWKVPILQTEKPIRVRPSLKKSNASCINMNRASNATFECNKSVNQNISLNLVGNVYSQSLTVDPFLSSTYFYDEEAVAKFEKEFKRWLNYILTPPADLDCNVEQKIDVGKAWIEHRNKEVPLAPTKEQVSSAYHNSHRLDSLRRSAKALLLSPEICQVFQKLNAQIEKKLIVIRTDRNPHLDIGLQKAIMELLLCYNPLWLRIGLEALYCLVLPLKSNSDIEGMTIFIIQRMFKNPFLKNKHSKSSAPNMLLPAYVEAIKKFTLKKFFMLVFFLDQAKQRKLISHDPCLFRRNAICKESREIVIRFTRELIAGIGDITKHLRPLGYVVSHKQTYLDEYIYAVHNIAVDIRDGVRLTKVMEIIMMKNGLLNQLRTPAISRLQKIHNVQVALNALKEANFAIVGDITATDIADGHREKTMSLLWQLIHVFRAPLFETAANVIQTWWKKKYKVIIEKRQEEERLRLKIENAARTIQCWWQRIQYNRLVERQMQLYTNSTIIIQKYCRRWLCRTRLQKMKIAIRKIEEWYISVKKMGEAKDILKRLRLKREELRLKSAIQIQRNFRRWLCVTRYHKTVKSIVLIQSLVRRFLARKSYLKVRKSIIFIQQKYKSKLLMKKEMTKLAQQKHSAVVIQKQYRMLKQFRIFQKLKSAVKTIENHYEAKMKMRQRRNEYLTLRNAAIVLQTHFRGRQVRKYIAKQKYLIVALQRKIKAHQLMKKELSQFITTRNATRVLQTRFRSYLIAKKVRQEFVTQRQSAIVIQRRFRAYLLGRSGRSSYIRMRNAAITLQTHYRSLIVMRQQKMAFIKLKSCVILIQRFYRALLSMKRSRESYQNLRAAIVLIQRKYRARIEMKVEKSKYLKMRRSCIKIQNFYRAVAIGRKQRNLFQGQKAAATKIQNWFRSCRKGKEIQQQYQQTKQACVTIQRVYRMYVISKKQRMEYLRIKTATVCIQSYYRSYIEMKTVREQYIQLKTCTVTIQRFYRGHLETVKHRNVFLQTKDAALFIQHFYRRYKETKIIRQNYELLRKAVICVQKRYRAIMAMRQARNDYMRFKKSAVSIQRRYRALLDMRRDRNAYLKLRSAALIVQNRYRAQLAMKSEKLKFNRIAQATLSIQRFFRSFLDSRTQRMQYLKLKQSAITLQRRYRALLAMRSCRSCFMIKKSAAVYIQRQFRSHCLMVQERTRYVNVLKACVTIQQNYRAYVAGKKQRLAYMTLKSATVALQKHYRNIKETIKIRNNYLHLKQTVVIIQRRFRAIKIVREKRHDLAAKKIQNWYRSIQERNLCRNKFLNIKYSVTLIQSVFRMYTQRKRWLALNNAVVTIQRFYKHYKKGKSAREEFILIKSSVIKLQAHFRRVIARKRYLNYLNEIRKQRREAATVCIQKNIRRYIVRSRYLNYRKNVVYIQRMWRGKLLMRQMSSQFMQNKAFIVKLQAVVRGYLIRQQVKCKKENLIRVREEQRQHWAASKIQALFRGHMARVDRAAHSQCAAALRRRWRDGALLSTQDTLQMRNEEAMDVLNNFADMESVVKAFRSLELLTEVFPMMYNATAPGVVRRVYTYMSFMNRSISSVDVLKSAGAVLANLTRYRVTGPHIYERDHISPILKYMWRFSNSEPQLFLILCTYLWLFHKYDAVREDLTEYLHIPENHKMLVSIKGNVDRVRRMAQNANKLRPVTPGKGKLSASFCSNSVVQPALEPDYGIARVNQHRYFEDTQQAIHCLFRTYRL